MIMTLEQQRDIIQAAIDGSKIEFADIFTGKWCSKHDLDNGFDFQNFTYRIAPPALRQHWPAVIRYDNSGVIAVTDRLYTSDDEARSDREGGPPVSVIRLATEYPPVMLP